MQPYWWPTALFRKIFSQLMSIEIPEGIGKDRRTKEQWYQDVKPGRE